MYEIKIETNFSAAHHLLNYEGNCENQHGHNWRVEVFLKGENLDKSNILVDFKVLKKEINNIVNTLDHNDINTLEYFKDNSPSSEVIAHYIYEEAKQIFPQVSKVAVWETNNACASYFEE